MESGPGCRDTRCRVKPVSQKLNQNVIVVPLVHRLPIPAQHSLQSRRGKTPTVRPSDLYPNHEHWQPPGNVETRTASSALRFPSLSKEIRPKDGMRLVGVGLEGVRLGKVLQRTVQALLHQPGEVAHGAVMVPIILKQFLTHCPVLIIVQGDQAQFTVQFLDHVQNNPTLCLRRRIGRPWRWQRCRWRSIRRWSNGGGKQFLCPLHHWKSGPFVVFPVLLLAVPFDSFSSRPIS